MGSNSSSNGGGNSGSDAFVNKKSKVKEVKRDKFGYTKKTNKVVDFISGGGVTGAIIGGLTKGEEVNRNYYDTKVKNYSGNTKGTYEDYIKARSRGEVDAMGRTISKSDNGGATGTSGQVVQAPQVTAPTTAEVSQSTETDAEDPILLRKRKAKAKGRSPTIMTGVTGATGSLTLGKPSLLGR
jgi:hypothetical protein